MEPVGSVMNLLRQERDYRRTRNVLHAMDDHRLRDIGVEGDQIDSLVHESRRIERKRAAAEAQNRRNEKARRRTLGGGGFAAQH